MSPGAIVSRGRLPDSGQVRWVQGPSQFDEGASRKPRLHTLGYSGADIQGGLPAFHISWPTNEGMRYAAENFMTANQWSERVISSDDHTIPVERDDTTAQFWPATMEHLRTVSKLYGDNVRVFTPSGDAIAMTRKMAGADPVSSWLADTELLGDSQLRHNRLFLTEGLSPMRPSVENIRRALLDQADSPSRSGHPLPQSQDRRGVLSTIMGSYRHGLGHDLASATTQTFMPYQHAETEDQPVELQTPSSQDKSGELSAVLESIRNRLRHDLAGAKIRIFFSRHPADLAERPALHELTTHIPVQQVQLVDNAERDRLLAKLMASFEDDPIEDGMDHLAEDIIAEALGSEKQDTVLGWLADFCTDMEHPAFTASLLRCLGRLERAGTDSWRKELVRYGLSADDAEIRDAAVQAAESWGDSSLIEVLEAHSEPEPWLHQYIVDVIGDLAE